MESVAGAAYQRPIEVTTLIRIVLQEAFQELGKVLKAVLLQLLLDDGHQRLHAQLHVLGVAVVPGEHNDLVLRQLASSQLH